MRRRWTADVSAVSVQDGGREEQDVEIRAKSHSADAAMLRPYVSANDSDSLALAASAAEASAADAHLRPRPSPLAPRDDSGAVLSSGDLSDAFAMGAVAPLSDRTPTGSVSAPGSGGGGAGHSIHARAHEAQVADDVSDSLQLGGPGVAAEVLSGSGEMDVESGSGRAIRLDTTAARRMAATAGMGSAGSATLRYYAPSPSPTASPLGAGGSGGVRSSTLDSFRMFGADNTASTVDTTAASPVGPFPAKDGASGGGRVRSFSPMAGVTEASRRRSGEAVGDGVGGETGGGDRRDGAGGSDSGSGEAPWGDAEGPSRHIYQPLSEETAAGAIAEAPPLLPFVTNDMFQVQGSGRGARA